MCSSDLFRTLFRRENSRQLEFALIPVPDRKHQRIAVFHPMFPVIVLKLECRQNRRGFAVLDAAPQPRRILLMFRHQKIIHRLRPSSE